MPNRGWSRVRWAAAFVGVLSSPHATARSQNAAPRARLDTVRATVREGTWLAFDRSRDGRQLAIDLLGQLWVLPSSGGSARAVTDAVRDSAEDDDPAFAPDGRSLVFAGERAGRAGLWRVDLATHRVERLTVAPEHDAQPAWSPDGRTIAFVRTMGELREGKPVAGTWLHLLDVASRAVRRIPLGDAGRTSVRDPMWSADGRTVYVVAPSASRPSTVVAGPVWAVDVVTGAHSIVGDSAAGAFAIAPSPDARTLAYVAADSQGRPQLWTLAFGTGARRQLTAEAELSPRRVRWAGDDTLLFVSAGRLRRIVVGSGELGDIPFTAEISIPRARTALPSRRFPAAGTRQRARGHTGLALSADGAHAAMIALGRLWIIPTRGGAARAVARLPEGARDVDWSPSGDRVVYAAGSWGAEDLHVLELATGRDARITALRGREVVPRWSPDGRWIAFLRAAPDSEPHLVVLPGTVHDTTSAASSRDLGPVSAGEWVIGIEAAGAPTWRPDSRALLAWRHAAGPLVREPFAHLRASVGEVVPLEGQRMRLARFPVDPTWIRWANDGSLLYVEGDRIMRARLHGDSVGEPVPVGADAALYLSASRDASLLYVSGDGLRVRARSGAVRRLGWPVSYLVPTAPPLVVRNARIIDGTGAPASDTRDLLLRDGRIARIADAGTLRPRGAQVLDAQGGVVMPGLSDLHSHQDGAEQLRGALYHGITLLRDQGSDLATVAARADEALSGDGDFPRHTYGGFQAYTDWAFGNGVEQGLEPERDSGHMARMVSLLAAHGAEHVKVRTGRGWSGHMRIIAMAHRAGLRVTGHCILPLGLIAAGMEAKEHLGHTCLERDNAPLHDDVLQVLRRSDVSIVPTTIVYAWERAWLADTGFLRRADVAPFTVAAKRDKKPTDVADTTYWIHDQGALMLDQARALHRAGVPMGVGCDAPLLPWCAHAELERLVEAGFSPLEAIRAGTLESARITGHDSELGSVQTGKLADLLVLAPDAEPWRDVRHTRRIRTVILAGRIVDRAALLRRGRTDQRVEAP